MIESACLPLPLPLTEPTCCLGFGDPSTPSLDKSWRTVNQAPLSPRGTKRRESDLLKRCSFFQIFFLNLDCIDTWAERGWNHLILLMVL